MGKYPTHKGNVSVRKEDKWEKIGECVIWVNDDNSVSGVVEFDAEKVEPNKDNKIRVNFRAWK